MEFKFTLPTDKSIEINGLSRINVILGRNGAGKSRFLRALDENMANDSDFRVNYITPERSGSFKRDGNVETNMASNPAWSSYVRRANQVDGSSFKAMSHLALRNAEIAYLRKLQNVDARTKSFQTECLYPISKLLSNISIEQGNPDFVFRTMGGVVVEPNQLSSGESETIALASEVLSFFMAVDPNKKNVLLLDEPDVHQHPDLQARFGQYLLSQLAQLQETVRENVFVVIASHSTALVCALAASDFVAIGNKEFDSDIVSLRSVAGDLKKVAPFFGHPLSLSLSDDPLLILEGEDDERVWQQAARSSQGRIRIFPVLAQSVDQQASLEVFCDKILTSIYDTPKAFSLRDGDGTSGPIDAIGCVTRFRLQCYAIENVLVTTECLAKQGVEWAEFQSRANAWIEANQGHKDATLLQQLVDSHDRLRNTKIKSIRQLIVSVVGMSKPWEVVVGQALAGEVGGQITSADPFALLSFIGKEPARGLLQAKEADLSHPCAG